MRIVQTVFGVFHHFELARELEKRGHLQRVYSTWPWARLKREGLQHGKVETFPWLHMAEMAARRAPWDLRFLTDALGYSNALAFDRWTGARLASLLRQNNVPNALVGISGSSLATGASLQREGGVYVCDRGSSHQRFQAEINREEAALWKIDSARDDPRDTVREEACYAQADAITVPSTFARRSFVQCGVPPEKLHLIPYGVRLEAFSKISEPPADTFEVVFGGQVDLRKGVPYLLQAFAQLRHPHKRLRLAGSVSIAMKSLLNRLPQDQVEFLGPLPQAQLPTLFSGSHVLVLPSIEDGFGMVLNQAMACGCPVIASTNSGGLDLVTEGVDGFIVPIRDPATLADRLQQLADDPGLRQRMSEAALRKVASGGGWKDYGDAWETLLLKLTSGN